MYLDPTETADLTPDRASSMAQKLSRERIRPALVNWFNVNSYDVGTPCPRFEIYGALGRNRSFRTLTDIERESMSRKIQQMETKMNEEVYDVPGKGVISVKFYPLDQAPKCPACGRKEWLKGRSAY
jgi:hypothetical protein